MNLKKKLRQFCVTIHNCRKDIEDIVKEKYEVLVKEMLMSVEPYPEQEGYHLHLFLQFPNQRYGCSVLAELEKLSKKIQAPRPVDCKGDWGRVHIEEMRGRFDQAEDYLLGMTKDKPTGTVMSFKKKPCWRRMRYTKTIGDKKNMEEFCGRCGSAGCPGCCPGCRICDDNVRRQEDQKFCEEIISRIIVKDGGLENDCKES